jgi:hypothetical protein
MPGVVAWERPARPARLEGGDQAGRHGHRPRLTALPVHDQGRAAHVTHNIAGANAGNLTAP